MDVSTFLLSALSDNVLLYSQIILMSVITGKRIIKTKAFISCGVVIITDLLFGLSFFETFFPLQWAAIVFNSIKVCLLTLYSLKTFRLSNFFISLIVQFICSVLSAGINTVCRFKSDTLQTYTLTLLAVRLSLLICSHIIYKKHKDKLTEDISMILPNHIYILILIFLFTENGLMRNLGYKTNNNDLKILIAEFLVLLLIIFTTVLIVSLTVNTAHKRYYLMLNTILEKQVKSQLMHYEKMERVNSEIRQFRHDYTNHMNCIASMIKGDKKEDSLKYIKNLSGILPTDKFFIKTGNYIADAIISDKQEEAEKHDTVISFEGVIPAEINSTDLCIILSNALDNAIEACSKISGQKTISVYGNFQQGCVVIIIKNPSILNWNKTQELPASSKEDSENHGLGLLNIQRTVKKYNGNMNISTTDNMFILGISIDPRLEK